MTKVLLLVLCCLLALCVSIQVDFKKLQLGPAVQIDLDQAELDRLTSAKGVASGEVFDVLNNGNAFQIYGLKGVAASCAAPSSASSSSSKKSAEAHMDVSLQQYQPVIEYNPNANRCGKINGKMYVCCDGFFCNFPNGTCGTDPVTKEAFTVNGYCTKIPNANETCPFQWEKDQLTKNGLEVCTDVTIPFNDGGSRVCGCDGYWRCAVCEHYKKQISVSVWERCAEKNLVDAAVSLYSSSSVVILVLALVFSMFMLVRADPV